MLRIQAPLLEEAVRKLKAGDRVLIDGPIYTARDAAHKRLVGAMEAGGPVPLDVEGQIMFYVGPCPPKPGQAIGSAGPTTSFRMDPYTPALLRRGLRAMIGKGYRSLQVVQAMKDCGAVYLVATGGAAALIADRVKSSELVAYGDLGTEAIRKLMVEDFPAIVAIDSEGRDLYAEAPVRYGRTRDEGIDTSCLMNL